MKTITRNHLRRQGQVKQENGRTVKKRRRTRRDNVSV